MGEILDATGGRGADVVFEAVGLSPTVDQSVRAARLGAQVTWIGNSDPRVELGMQDVVTKELTLRGAYGYVDEFDGRCTRHRRPPRGRAAPHRTPCAAR